MEYATKQFQDNNAFKEKKIAQFSTVTWYVDWAIMWLQKNSMIYFNLSRICDGWMELFKSYFVIRL